MDTPEPPQLIDAFFRTHDCLGIKWSKSDGCGLPVEAYHVYVNGSIVCKVGRDQENGNVPPVKTFVRGLRKNEECTIEVSGVSFKC